MESFVRQIYLGEICIQCGYAHQAVAEIDGALVECDTARQEKNLELLEESLSSLFHAIHSFLTHASNVSRLLWPGHEKEEAKLEKAKSRGEELRSILGLPDNHLLRNRKLRNHLEHYDTRLDDWADSSPNRSYVGHVVASRDFGKQIIIKGERIPDSDIMRRFDPATFKFIFRGEEFKLQPIVTAIKDIAAKAEVARQPEWLQRMKQGLPPT